MIYLLREGLFLSLPLPKNVSLIRWKSESLLQISSLDHGSGGKQLTGNQTFHEYLSCFLFSFTPEGLILKPLSACTELPVPAPNTAREQGAV